MSIYPPTKWYQDMSNLFITISESDLNNVEYEFQEDKIMIEDNKVMIDKVFYENGKEYFN